MSAWIEIQEAVVANPVYVGPGSGLLNSWMFDAAAVLLVFAIVLYGARGGLPRL